MVLCFPVTYDTVQSRFLFQVAVSVIEDNNSVVFFVPSSLTPGNVCSRRLPLRPKLIPVSLFVFFILIN